VVSWVQREMTYEITPRYIDDVTLLGTRRGDCTEYAQLTVALLRALDVPARVRIGMLVSGTSMVVHAWAEFHDGNAWHEIDPTAGRSSVDASYVDASVMDLLPLLLDGRNEVTAIETL
jgi:transglutaminase-like putative cysteine protease